MDLSPDQQVVFDAIVKWSLDPATPLLTMGGLAGSGKTTLLGAFAAQSTLQVAYVTFTGRASSILARKFRAANVKTTSKVRPPLELRSRSRPPTERMRALYDFDLTGGPIDPPFVGTIHRLLYMPIIDSETEELRGWRKRTELDRLYDIIVIDEASMVNVDMIDDLQHHAVPTLAVGDHGQLPPVMSGGDLMAEPMLRLEKIHRQAELSPIIRLAHEVRSTGQLGPNAINYRGDDHVTFTSRANVGVIESAFRDAPNPLDVGVLCWTNKTRIRMNSYARRGLGRKGVPTQGEVVICLKNSPPIYNGMRGVLTTDGALEGHLLTADVAFPEEELPAESIEMCAGQFNRERPFKNLEDLHDRGISVHSMKEGGALYDFGYAMTCHKAQGSQFDHAIVYFDREVQPESLDFRRWAYTAITRAVNRLTILM